MTRHKRCNRIRKTQSRRRRRRFRFRWKTALVYWPLTAVMLFILIDALFILVIQRPSVWHWIVAVFIVGMGIELARAKLQAR